MANHGFDNEHPDMKTTLIARGPDFNCGYKQDSMRSVDLYPLMCHVLGLETCHTSDGDLERARGMVNSDSTSCLPEGNGSNAMVASAGFALLCLLHGIFLRM